MGYDYYEFMTVDRQLSQAAMDSLRGLGRKALVTPTMFSLTTYYESAGVDPDDLLSRYFDAYIHLNNYGLRELAFKFPRRAIDLKAWQPYLSGEDLACRVDGDAAILTMRTQREGGGWEYGEGWLLELLPCRTELVEGDLRPLYLAWLGVLEYGEVLEDDDHEPPVPPALATLTDAQKVFVNYLALDWSLVDAAAEAASSAPTVPSRDDLLAWMAGLPQSDKDQWLTSWVLEDDASARLEILGRFREAHAPAVASRGRTRRVADLLDRWGERHQEAEEEERRHVAQEREERLASLAEDVPGAWELVDDLLADNHWKRRSKAIALLLQLKELSEARGSNEEFQARMAVLRTKYRRRPALLARFDQAAL